MSPRDADKDAETGLDSPGRYGMLALLRYLERKARRKPRIGRNQRLREEIVRLGQDPFLAFPDNDMSKVDLNRKVPVARPQFLGFFGPHGALPLNTTEEVLRWTYTGDNAFVAFTDIFATRFQELFFRSWSDARAISQFDHPGDDRFQTYLLSFTGLGTAAFRDRDSIPDAVKLNRVALALGRVKSPVRLQQMLELHFRIDVEVEEMLPTWLAFEPDALSRLGAQGSTLGRDMHLGSRVQSIGEKICIHIRVGTLAAYRRFLPGQPDFEHLRDIVHAYLGKVLEVDVAVWLPRSELPPAVLGQSTELGWMACLVESAPDPGLADEMVRATTYRLPPGQMHNEPISEAA